MVYAVLNLKVSGLGEEGRIYETKTHRLFPTS